MMSLLEKPFLTCKDIMQVLDCSPSKASRIRRKIREELAKSNKTLATNEVPTKLFIKVMCLDVPTNE